MPYGVGAIFTFCEARRERGRSQETLFKQAIVVMEMCPGIQFVLNLSVPRITVLQKEQHGPCVQAHFSSNSEPNGDISLWTCGYKLTVDCCHIAGTGSAALW